MYPGVGKVRAGLASAINQVSYNDAYGGAAQQSHTTFYRRPLRAPPRGREVARAGRTYKKGERPKFARASEGVRRRKNKMHAGGFSDTARGREFPDEDACLGAYNF